MPSYSDESRGIPYVIVTTRYPICATLYLCSLSLLMLRITLGRLLNRKSRLITLGRLLNRKARYLFILNGGHKNYFYDYTVPLMLIYSILTNCFISFMVFCTDFFCDLLV